MKRYKLDSPILEAMLVADTDSYKFSHWLQYPPKTTAMRSYFESRGGMFGKTMFTGLQFPLREYLTERVTVEMVNTVAGFAEAHGVPFNKAGWMRIATVLDGKIPIRIRAVPEGTVISKSNMLMSVESTDPESFWVVSWYETMLVRLWMPISVGTYSYYCRKLIHKYLEETADNPDDEILFKLHDFGSRGATCREHAMIGGAAHLINFLGSDTVVGVILANEYYNNGDMSAFSISAAEHSTITMWGREFERDAYANMIKQYALKDKVVAIVIDSYNTYDAVGNHIGSYLKQDIIDSGAVVVVRPDSGYPPEVVLKILQILDLKFGTEKNSKGYKVLPPYIRVIQGDGINIDSIEEILETIKEAGYSASNVGFGMGGALLQKHDRDTHKFAFKCNVATVDGKIVEVFKDPITDTGKRSKAGYLDLIRGDKPGEFKTVKMPDENYHPDSVLDLVYENGEVKKTYTLEEVRARAWS